MKALKQIVLIGIGMAGIGLYGEDKAPEAKDAAVVELEYVEVKGFTDFEYSGMSEVKTGRIFEKRVQRYFEGNDRLIPKGYHLKLTVTDVDLAGEVEPWRSRNGEDIRYVRSHYYPRMSFSWVLLNEEGDEVARGEERLKDMTFDLRVSSFNRNEPFFYELEMLGDWAKKMMKTQVEAE